MNEKLLSYLVKPEIYTESTAKFWDDEYISKSMLAAHLDPEFDGATRKHQFVDQSVEWIAGIVPPSDFEKLLDLGCGPGLYAERFYQKGYQVTGIDGSRRSIDYAKQMAAKSQHKIIYHYQDYRQLNYHEEFDVITLIYRDFCVLPDSGRLKLLDRIYHALKPKGRFIVDVTAPHYYDGKEEYKTWSYQQSGFWSGAPYLCLSAFYRYEESRTFLNQEIIISEDQIRCYYLWDHTFIAEELCRDLKQSGFDEIGLYGDIAGARYQAEGDCICAVAVKGF